MATTPISSIDSPNIVKNAITNYFSVTGSIINQAAIDYFLSPKYSFTGSVNPVDNSVDFSYGILAAPTIPSASLDPTTKLDFQFYLNGVRIDNEQVLGFNSVGSTNSGSKANFDLGYPLRSYDVVTGVGKFQV